MAAAPDATVMLTLAAVLGEMALAAAMFPALITQWRLINKDKTG